MTSGEHQSLTELVRQMLARARDTAWRNAEIRATAAEFTVIAEDLCFRARAERGRARELAGERLGRGHPGAVAAPTAVAAPAAAIRGPRQGGRRV